MVWPARDPRLALEQLGTYFMGTSPLHKAALELSRHLEEAGIDYAIAGALCLNAHGVMRATEDVDVVITREGLEQFKSAWLGRGYVELRAGGKPVRDTATGVRIDFLITGDYPGDGKPKPVAFPVPATVAEVVGELRVVTLPRFIELKLASGMTAPHRLQDLADVLRLIETRQLPRALATELDSFVRAKYDELWQTAQHPLDDY
jgi:hypothetical protein